MKNTMKNRRYTKQEVRRNRFYQLPQFIFTEDEYKYQLSPVAKLVYILLRNRHDLSLANGWENEDGEVYFVYTRENLAEDLGISVPTASKAMEQLRNLGLLEEQKRFNKSNLIYMTFVDIDTYIPSEYLKQEENVNKEKDKEDIKNDKEKQTTGDTESFFESIDKDSLSQEEEKQTAGNGCSSHTENFFKSINKDSLSPQLKKFKPNQTDLKETNLKETNNLSYLSIDNIIKDNDNIKTTLKGLVEEILEDVLENILEKAKKEVAKEIKNENNNTNSQTETNNQSTTEEYKQTTTENTYESTTNTGTNRKQKKKKRKAKQQKNNTSDAYTTEEYNKYREIISQNIEYETIKGDSEIIQGLFETLVDAVTSKAPTIRVEGVDRQAESVKSRFLKLNAGHIQYVVECLKNCKSNIRNISAYMLTALYKSYVSIDAYYTTKVNYDLNNDSSDSCA